MAARGTRAGDACGGSACLVRKLQKTRNRRLASPHSHRGCRSSGWIIGRNVQIEYRYGTGNAARVRRHAAELAALAPDIIVTTGASTVPPLLQATRTIPIVFVNVADPVGSGFVESLSRPGGNVTGFMNFEYSLSAKWPELLRQISPAPDASGSPSGYQTPRESGSSPLSSPWRHRSVWRSCRSMPAMQPKSDAPWRSSRVGQMAA